MKKHQNRKHAAKQPIAQTRPDGKPASLRRRSNRRFMGIRALGLASGDHHSKERFTQCPHFLFTFAFMDFCRCLASLRLLKGPCHAACFGSDPSARPRPLLQNLQAPTCIVALWFAPIFVNVILHFAAVFLTTFIAGSFFRELFRGRFSRGGIFLGGFSSLSLTFSLLLFYWRLIYQGLPCS